MGTPNIAGQYKGPVSVVVRASQPGPSGDMKGKVQACSRSVDYALVPAEITFDFDNKVVILGSGLLTPRPGLPMTSNVEYSALGDPNGDTNVLSMQETGDGLYKVSYYWKVEPQGGAGPSMTSDKTDITLEITQLVDDNIVFVTCVEPDSSDCTPGKPLPNFQPSIGPMLDWRGRAEKI